DTSNITRMEAALRNGLRSLDERVDDCDMDLLWNDFKESLRQSYELAKEREVANRYGRTPASGRGSRRELRAGIHQAVEEIRHTPMHDHRSIWSLLRKRLGVKGRSDTIPGILQAEDFAAYMRELYTPPDYNHPRVPARETGRPVGYRDPEEDPQPAPAPPSPNEVFEATARLKKGKGPGIDGISGDLLNQSPVLQRWIHKICEKCFVAEKQPTEWLTSKVTLIKKGRKAADTVMSYRTVMAQVAAAKIYSAVILGRIRDQLDKRIHHSQCGFRKFRSAVEVIHATQLLRDACIAYNRPLCLLMADWKKAFDKLDRKFMMDCLQAAGIHPKYLRDSYDRKTCEVKLGSGVKQGDIWSPIIFITSLDMILRRSIITAKRGFVLLREHDYNHRHTRFSERSYSLQEPIGCLCFADDITVPTNSQGESDLALDALEEEAAPANLSLGIGEPECKTRRLLINCQHDSEHNSVAVVTEYRQLGVLISSEAGYVKAIRDRIRVAGANLHRLHNIWKSHDIGIRGKMVVMRSVVFASLFYGSETMALNKEETQMFKTFYNTCLRKVIRLPPMTTMSSKELCARTRSAGCLNELRARRLRWYGHLMRSPDDNVAKRLLEWNPRVHNGSRGAQSRARIALRALVLDALACKATKHEVYFACRNRSAPGIK
ncbi:conserved hypothetical protein, partial [Perkinsus marinus ATCC 50983]